MFFEQFGPAEIFESCSDKNRNLCLFLIKLGKESLPSLQTVVGTVAVLFLAWAGVIAGSCWLGWGMFNERRLRAVFTMPVTSVTARRLAV